MLQNPAKILYSVPKQYLFGGECMAGSVQYHKSAKRWYIYIYWQGKRHKLWRDYHTFQPFITKSRALKYLAILQKQIEDHDFDPRYWKPESPISVRVYAMEWLDQKKVTYRTWRDYKTDVTKYIIPFLGDMDIRHLKAKSIRLFKEWLDTGLAPKTVYNKMGVLKTMLKDAYRDEDIKRVPPFPRLPTDKNPIQYITLEQQLTLIEAIPERDRPIFMFMMEYGLRIGEGRAIQKDCIVDGKVIIKRAFSDNILKDTKTGLVREYELTEYAQEILDSLDKHLSPFVFVREDGKPYTNKNLNAIWHEAEEKTGIKIKLYNAVRHSLGCQLLDLGYEMDLVRQLLGHTKTEMTMRYAERSNPTITRALEGRRARVVKLKDVK